MARGRHTSGWTVALAAAGMWLACAPLPAAADNVTFCYHRFGYSLEQIYTVLPEVLEWQLEYIRGRKLAIIPARELGRRYAAKSDLGDSAVLTVDDGWRDFLRVAPVLERAGAPVTLFIYPQIIGQGRAYFTQPELLRLGKSGLIDFGCHSYSHIVLRHASEETLAHEVVDSKQKLETMLGRPVETFAYPFGLADRRVKALAGRHYRLVFGVREGGNRADTDPAELNRFIIYKTTGFGEFMEAVGRAGANHPAPDYTVHCLGWSRGRDRYFNYAKVKLYASPDEGKSGKVFVLPSSALGAGWLHKPLARLRRAGIQAYVMVNRNHNLPLYRPAADMGVISEWGLPAYLEDLRLALGEVLSRSPGLVVITWGDGFDLLMALLATDPAYAAGLRGVIALNPSVRNADNTAMSFRQAADRCRSLLRRGEYASQDLGYFLKIKTLADLMIVKPDSLSPFAKTLGFPGASNRDIFLAVIDRQDHPDLSLNAANRERLLPDFRRAFLQPLPLFALVVPVRWLKDVHQLWYQGFYLPEAGIVNARRLKLPVAYFYSDAYAANLERIRGAFPALSAREEYAYAGLSTVEIMLDDATAERIASAVGRFSPPRSRGPGR